MSIKITANTEQPLSVGGWLVAVVWKQPIQNSQTALLRKWGMVYNNPGMGLNINRKKI